MLSVAMVRLIELRSRALDGDDAAEDGVTQHGRHGEQDGQDLVAAFVRLVIKVAEVGVNRSLPARSFWVKKQTNKKTILR